MSSAECDDFFVAVQYCLYWSLLEADVLVFTGKHCAVLSLLERAVCADLYYTVLCWSLLEADVLVFTGQY
jgi:hypothetical protein